MAYNLRLVVCFLSFILRLIVGRAQTDPPTNTEFSSDPPANTLFSSDTPVQILHQLGGFENVNPTHVNGVELYEGDIMLSAEQRKQIFERKAQTYVLMWPNGESGTPVVPYKFGDALVNTAAVEAGIAHWEEHTCIDFQELPDTDEPYSYLNFTRGNGCWSYVGLIPIPQEISIGTGCTDLGTVVHEIGHAMGLLHEQSRSDRDDYVSIIFENIQERGKYDFQKMDDNNYSIPYDFYSDMHYGSHYYTSNGKNTITTKYPLAQGIIGDRDRLSHYDKLLANTMYPCISKWMETCNLATNPCQNDGYVGKDCNCVCRDGTTGNHCEIVNQGYYDSLIPSCSENVTAPGTVTSPNYPENAPAGIRCVKWIQAPKCYTVKIKFNYFRLYGKAQCGRKTCCVDNMEIRTTNLTVGDVYCDDEISVGTEFTSPSNQIILYFEIKSNLHSRWSADVIFVPTSSCTLKDSLSGEKHLPSMPTGSSSFDGATRHLCNLKGSLSDEKHLPSMPTGSSSFDRATRHLCNLKGSLSGEKHLPSMPTGSSSFDGATRHLCNLKGSLSDEKHLPSMPTGSSSFDRATRHLCNLKGSLSGEKHLLSMPTGSSFFNRATRNKSPNCHQLINTVDVGTIGMISPPTPANYPWERKACEIWIRSPAGTKIKLTFTKMSTNTNVIVNKAGFTTYPSSSTSYYSGPTIPAPITSVANAMNVLLFGSTDNKDFVAFWSVI